MQRSERHTRLTILFSLGIFISIVVMISIIIINVQTDELQIFLEDNALLPILLFVENENSLIMSHLVFFETTAQRMAIYDVPIRFGAIIPSLGRVDRLDNFYNELGANRTREILETIFQTDIQFYTVFSLSDIEVIVDLVEGISVFLPEPIEFTSENEVQIRLPSGNSLLDGEKILSVIQYRGNEERELEWISRRWNFVQEMFRSIQENVYINENEDYFDRFAEHFPINLNDRGKRTFLNLLSDIALSNILTQRILGTDRLVETNTGEEVILFPHFDGQLVRDSIDQISRSLRSLEDSFTSVLIRLEILNGTGINGLAARTRDLYQNFGFDVVRIGNAEFDTRNTVIIDRADNRENAEEVGRLIRAERIESAEPLDDFPSVDITIILGEDFDGLYVQPSEE